MSFTVKLAGIGIQLEPYTQSLQNTFSDFMSSCAPDIKIEITASMVEKEAQIRREYFETPSPDVVLSDASSEGSAVCRAISEKLPEFGSFLLHGSAITYNGSGIVFVASSGTGKSTFSRSWSHCFPNEVLYINDDKPFVRIKSNIAEIYGSPWNGKHHLGSNSSAPLKAICLIERSNSNWVKKTTAIEVLPEVLSHLYIPENASGRGALFSLMQELPYLIAFYRVGCNMDPDAAVTCKEVLFNNDHTQF